MEKIQKRLNALRNIQLEIDQAESKLSEEIIQLECKHAPVFDALYKKRESIVNGEREPNEDEAKWDYENVDLSEMKFETNKPGIAGFWLRVLEMGNLTSGIILEDDKPILKHLKNIKLKQNSQKPYGFTLEFHFEDNEYFKNKVLTKSYEFTLEKDKRNPLNSSNNSLYKCTGCVIEWNEGKSPVKDSDDEESGSFFDFFRTHTPDGMRPAFNKDKKAPAKNGNGKKADEGDDHDDDEEELEHLFELDYEIGKFIKDMIIPKALLFYTGEINEEMDEMEDESDIDDEDDDDDDDDDDDNENDDDDDEQDNKPKKKVKTK